MHKVNHIADGVHSRHLFLYGALLIIEELHFVRSVEIVLNGVWVIRKACQQVFIYWLFLCYSFYEVWYDFVILVLPRILVSPMVVKVALYLLHLLDCSFLGILLHTGVDGGVNLQT